MARRSNWRAQRAARGKLWDQQNRPPEGKAWIWMTEEMIASFAWRALSHAALMVIFRLTIEHMAHGGAENGRLIVTFDQFRTFGVRRNSIAPAIREAEALGWITTTRKGRGGNADWRRASTYALAWLPRIGGVGANGEELSGELADFRWRTIESIDAARKLVDSVEEVARRERSA